MWDIKIIDPVERVSSFDINRKGLSLIEGDEFLEIYSDPFRSQPIYIYSASNSLAVFQNYPSFLKAPASSSFRSTIDKVAFYETVLFGTPLGTRTIYQEIKQLPAASCMRINKASGKFEISRYWHFDISEDKSIKSITDAAEQLNHHLKRIFDTFDVSSDYCMGLSGGMDSRLSLSYLSQRIQKHKIHLFTFGFDSRILEYSYAKAVSESLQMGDVQFHKLDAFHYREALDYLPLQSVGHVAINHSHITSYLRRFSGECGTQIANYYSDAIFGFAAHATKIYLPAGADNYSAKLDTVQFIPADIKEEIKSDISKMLDGYDEDSNYSSKNEYLYVTERNPKFHFNLAYCQSLIVPTQIPYADVELLKFMISVPLAYREQKVILDEIFKRYFPSVSTTNIEQISSRFSARFTSYANWFTFRYLNASNGIFRALSGGTFQLFNKYQTEEQEKILYSEFSGDLHAATAKFMAMGILSADQKIEFDKLPIRSAGVPERYILISLAKII